MWKHDVHFWASDGFDEAFRNILNKNGSKDISCTLLPLCFHILCIWILFKTLILAKFCLIICKNKILIFWKFLLKSWKNPNYNFKTPIIFFLIVYLTTLLHNPSPYCPVISPLNRDSSLHPHFQDNQNLLYLTLQFQDQCFYQQNSSMWFWMWRLRVAEIYWRSLSFWMKWRKCLCLSWPIEGFCRLLH